MTQPPPCCDLHGRCCEPPADLCCEHCTEAAHGLQWWRPGYQAWWWRPGQHADGSPCVLDGQPALPQPGTDHA